MVKRTDSNLQRLKRHSRVRKIKATVNEKDLEKQEEFTREFGQEG